MAWRLLHVAAMASLLASTAALPSRQLQTVWSLQIELRRQFTFYRTENDETLSDFSFFFGILLQDDDCMPVLGWPGLTTCNKNQIPSPLVMLGLLLSFVLCLGAITALKIGIVSCCIKYCPCCSREEKQQYEMA